MNSEPHSRIRRATPDDHAFFREWYRAAGRELNPAILPHTTFVIDHEGIPAAALALYPAHASPVGFIDHAMADPALSLARKKVLFTALVEAAALVAEAFGCQVVQVTTHHEGITGFLESRGWMPAVPTYSTALCFSQPPPQ